MRKKEESEERGRVRGSKRLTEIMRTEENEENNEVKREGTVRGRER